MMATEQQRKLPPKGGAKSPSQEARRHVEDSWELLHRQLAGHEGTVVQLSRPVLGEYSRIGEQWQFSVPELNVAGRGAEREEARRRAADQLATDVNRLTRAFVVDLSAEERKRRVTLLHHVDILGGEIGIDFPKDRWLLGRIKGARFEPIQEDFESIAIPAERLPEPDPERLWFARVATFRDGRLDGDVLELEAAPEAAQSREE